VRGHERRCPRAMSRLRSLRQTIETQRPVVRRHPRQLARLGDLVQIVVDISRSCMVSGGVTALMAPRCVARVLRVQEPWTSSRRRACSGGRCVERAGSARQGRRSCKPGRP